VTVSRQHLGSPVWEVVGNRVTGEKVRKEEVEWKEVWRDG